MSFTLDLGEHKDRDGKVHHLEALSDGFDVYVYEKGKRDNIVEQYDESGMFTSVLFAASTEFQSTIKSNSLLSDVCRYAAMMRLVNRSNFITSFRQKDKEVLRALTEWWTEKVNEERRHKVIDTIKMETGFD